MVVHASAGAAALAILVVVGRRTGWPKTESVPHSLPLALIGGGILWFGWFGFNAGDSLQADGVAAQALVNTQVSAAAAMCAWLVIERITQGHATAIGAVTGAVAGLATITPCVGYVHTLSALVIGALAGLICHGALRLKRLFRFDDALDVIAVHFVGGSLGSLLLGLFGQRSINPIGRDGLFFGGGAGLLGEQCLALISVIAFAFTITWLIAMGIEKTVGLRLEPTDQVGVDRKQQGMDAYHINPAFVVDGDAAKTVAAAPRQPDLVPTTTTGTHVLITVILQTLDPGRLRSALFDAGAVSIVVAEAHAPADRGTESLQFRGQQQDLAFSERLRVEVLVPAGSADAAIAAINHHSTGRSGGYLQQTVQPLGTRTEPDR